MILILMIMFSDDMSSLSHDEFMDLICGMCEDKLGTARSILHGMFVALVMYHLFLNSMYV